MHQYFGGAFTFISGAGFAGDTFQRYDFDSKAMRKVPEGSQLVWVVENATTAFGMNYLLQFAVLVKLA